MRPLIALTVLLLALPMAVAFDAPPDRVLKQVPDDAALVLVVPSIDRLTEGIAAFGKAIGVDALADLDREELLAPLAEAGLPRDFFEKLGSGSAFALAIRPESRAPVCIVSLSDPSVISDELLKDLQRAVDERGEDAALGFANGCLILAASRGDLDAALRSTGTLFKSVKVATKDLLENPDVVLYINVPRWKEVIEEGLLFAEGMLQMSVALAGPQAESGMAFWKWVFKNARSLTDETRAYGLTVRVNGDGVRLKDKLSFKPEGRVGRYLKNVRKTQAHLLRGLPDQRAAVIFGCEWECPEGTESLNAMMFRSVCTAASIKEELGEETIEAAVKQIAALHERLSGYNMSMSLAPDGGGMLFSGVYLTDDARAAMKQLRSVFEVSSKCMGVFVGNVAMDVERETDEIESVAVDVYRFSFDSEDETIEQGLKAIYGESPTFIVAPQTVGVLYAMGPAEYARERVAERLSGKAARLRENPRIVAAMKELSADPQVCALVDFAKLMEFGVNMAKAAGAPVQNLKFPKGDPAYASIGIYLEKDSVRGELFVPAKAVKIAVDAAHFAGAAHPQ